MDEALQKNIKEVFNKFDENHNGILEKEEFYKGFVGLIKSLAEGQTEAEIDKIAEEAIELI